MSESKSLTSLTATELRERIPACGNAETLLGVAAELQLLEPLVKGLLLMEERQRLQVAAEMPAEAWRQQRWGHGVQEAFIAARSRLERVSFWSARMRQKGLAMELYYQLCNGETSLETKAEQDGAIVLNSKLALLKLAKPIRQALHGAKPGRALPPLHVGNDYLVLELITWHPAELDTATETELLAELEQAWLDRELARRLEHQSPLTALTPSESGRAEAGA